MLQHPNWSRVGGSEGLGYTAWPSERVLSVEVKPDDRAWREEVLAGLTGLEEGIGADIARVSVSHLSIEPVAQYGAGGAVRVGASNVASAVPGLTGSAVATLADRFMLGVRAVDDLRERDVYEVSAEVLARSLPNVKVSRTISTDVCVAGAGTGGAVAALTAALAGADVVCLEPLAFAGGIGTGGGIHTYCFGVAGGFQQEVDRRTRGLMKRFRRGPLGDGAFNPWAKMIALEQMMREHRVDLRTGALVFEVEKRGDRVTAALAATPEGVVRVQADAFIDGTGDGDLCALAGARFTQGREHDGLFHAYTQSSGLLQDSRGRPRMKIVNFDAGFCDPADPRDITRARLAGIRQYLLPRYGNFTRPTYLAPALGLRQSRQIVTEYVLSLDDQIQGRRFDDPIGYTGAFADDHATDHEFGSDEALFWTWLNRQRTTPVACELSYRMLIPRGLTNVWIASRCLGVSQDAHYATRMQRDMQRVGEAAGFAAAEATKRGETSLQLPYAELRKWLDQTRALDRKPRNIDAGFGPSGQLPETVAPDEQSLADKALAALDRGEPGKAIWWLYRHKPLVYQAVLERLTNNDDQSPMVGWLAAGITAMWNDPTAEPRLVTAIETLEYGFNDRHVWIPVGYNVPEVDFNLTPLTWSYIVPNWLCAVALLRRCGTQACLSAIERLIERPVHGLDTLTTTAVTLEQLVQRGVLTKMAYPRVEAILDRMLSTRVIGNLDYPGRRVGRHSERAVRSETSTEDHEEISLVAPGLTVREQLPNTYIDATWQLHLSVGRARSALGLPPHDAAKQYRHDQRAYVQHAFDTMMGGL
jgi:hypothetical protein